MNSIRSSSDSGTGGIIVPLLQMAIIHPGTDVGMSCNDTSVHGRNVLQ